MHGIMYKTIKDIQPALWDSIITPDNIISSHAHLQAVEESKINNCEYRYILIKDIDHKLIAHTCIYAINFYLDIFNKEPSKRIILLLRKTLFPNLLKINLIECGTPTALGNTISFAKNADRQKALDLIINKMEKYANEKNVKMLLFRDFYKDDLHTFNYLRKFNFKKINNLPNALFKNNWKSFDEYLIDLRSHYRYRLKKIRKKLEKNSIKVKIEFNFSKHADELTKLWFNVYNNAKEYQREILTPEYFKNIDLYLKEKSCVILFKKNKKIIAFILSLIDDYTFRPLFVGMNYYFNKANKLYFNILCEEIKQGMRFNKKIIEMGLTTDFPKKMIGAQIVPLYGYMKHTSALLNLIITNLFILFSPNKHIKSVNVFNRRCLKRLFVNFKIEFSSNNKKIKGELIDINENGIKVKYIYKIKKRKSLSLKFFFPNTNNSFMIFGKIKWIKKTNKEYTAGVLFISNKQEIQNKLKKFVLIYNKNERN